MAYKVLKEYENGREDVAETVLQTTNVTPTVIDVISIPTDKTYQIEVFINCAKSDWTQKGSFKLMALYVNDGGAISLLGSVQYLVRQKQTGLNVVLVVVGTSVKTYVSGIAATTINWTCDRVAKVERSIDDAK